VAACLALTAGIVVADVAAGLDKTQYVGLLVAVPFLAATFTGVRGVLALGLLAWLAGLGIGLSSADGAAAPQYVRLACLAAAVGLAALAARSRVRRERRMVAVQSAADAASRAILHPLPSAVAGVPVAATYASASEAARVGGDLYDAVATSHGLRMVVGDVRGKGLEAVRLAASALGAFREGVHREPDLQQVAVAMHEAVRRDAGPEDFVTAVLVEVRDGSVRLLGCGHPHPLRLRAGQVAELAMPDALPLGLGPPGPAVPVDVRPGDRVLLFTDGAVEGRRGGRFFPLYEAVRDTLSSSSLVEAVEELARQVQAYPDGGSGDDVALLAFELPAAAPVVPGPVGGEATAGAPVPGRFEPQVQPAAGTRTP
jgi:serine phosphatase RsbU (regulator of sigma subunit)